LKKAGLIQTQTQIGVTGLMKNPEEISLLEILKRWKIGKIYLLYIQIPIQLVL